MYFQNILYILKNSDIFHKYNIYFLNEINGMRNKNKDT